MEYKSLNEELELELEEGVLWKLEKSIKICDTRTNIYICLVFCNYSNYLMTIILNIISTTIILNIILVTTSLNISLVTIILDIILVTNILNVILMTN